jgi:bifunctional DNase/RNase
MAYNYSYAKRRKKKIKNPFKKGKKRREWVKNAALLMVTTLLISVPIYFFLYDRMTQSSARESNAFVIFPELMTTNYKLVEVDVAYNQDQGIVTLTSDCREIVAYVEPHQAESIYRGIKGLFVERPNAHDIAVDAFESFGIEVVMVKITDLKDSAFHGRIILKKGNKIASLDARPSDATAIAVRVGAPVFVSNDLMETQGEGTCD